MSSIYYNKKKKNRIKIELKKKLHAVFWYCCCLQPLHTAAVKMHLFQMDRAR